MEIQPWKALCLKGVEQFDGFRSLCVEKISGLSLFTVRLEEHVDSVTIATRLRRRHEKHFLSIFTVFVFLRQIHAQSRYATHIQGSAYADQGQWGQRSFVM